MTQLSFVCLLEGKKSVRCCKIYNLYCMLNVRISQFVEQPGKETTCNIPSMCSFSFIWRNAIPSETHHKRSGLVRRRTRARVDRQAGQTVPRICRTYPSGHSLYAAGLAGVRKGALQNVESGFVEPGRQGPDGITYDGRSFSQGFGHIQITK